MERDYGRAFRIVRAALGLSQAELAERMPITASQLSLIEAGKRQPSVRVIDSLGQAGGVPTPLITLLASTQDELVSSQDLGDLARTLLRVLVSVGGNEKQKSLPFNGKK